MKESGHPIRNAFLIFLAGALAANITMGLQSWFAGQAAPTAQVAQPVANQSNNHGGFTELFFGTLWLPLAAVLIYLWLKNRNSAQAGDNSGSFGRSKARLFAPAATGGIGLDDIAGLDEAKDEVANIIRFLKNPQLIHDLGGRPIRGCLMAGPPGTGKTLLARAVAHTAQVPFFITSGSEFVEMLVGAGAARVRDLFAQARKHAPCIVFFDEIDAVGQVRGTGIGGGNDERQQTLNQLLVELDGIDPVSGVVFIAATNRADTLDPALLRPNRLGDIRINVELPDIRGREAILAVHARNKKLAGNVDLARVARRTFGYSGADLAGVMDQSVLVAVRRLEQNKNEIDLAKFEITQDDISEAMDRVKMGTSSATRSRRLAPAVKQVLAFHEFGHAAVSHFLFAESGGKCGAPVRKVTILGRAGAGGYMIAVPEEDEMLYTRESLIGFMATAMGGTLSEEIFLGQFTTGNANDLEKVYDIAKKMVTRWRMSSLGPISLADDSSAPFLGMRMAASGGYGLGGESANQIDREIKKILDQAELLARGILERHGDFVRFGAPRLMEEETIEEERWLTVLEEFEGRGRGTTV